MMMVRMGILQGDVMPASGPGLARFVLARLVGYVDAYDFRTSWKLALSVLSTNLVLYYYSVIPIKRFEMCQSDNLLR